MTELIKVTKQSRSTAVAGCIAGILREQPTISIYAIGAGAVNQSVKAIAIARGYLTGDGYDIVMQPHTELAEDLEDRTVIVMSLERVGGRP